MPRARITEPGRPRREPALPPALVAGESDFDATLGVYSLFLVIPRAEVVYFRLVLESWEDCAVARTMERFCEDDRTRTLVVALVVPDFLESCLRRLARLAAEIDGEQVPATPEFRERLRADLLGGEGDE